MSDMDNVERIEKMLNEEDSIESKKKIKKSMKEKREKKEKKQGKHPFLKMVVIAVISAIAVGGLGSVGIHLYRDCKNKPKQDTVAEAHAIGETDSTQDNTATDTSSVVSTSDRTTVSRDDISAVAENVTPAIVTIVNKSTTTYKDFFGREYQDESTSAGTGFIIGQNGSEILIATNNHVVENCTSLEITFADSSTAKATVKGTDAGYDLAVVSVETGTLSLDTISKIKIAVLGSSDNTPVGSMAIAIGNSLGYGQTLTAGFISALDREVSVDGRSMKLIQTDAAINNGNSGGPLLNIYGEVIGITSAKLVSTEVEGCGYAIPISSAIPIINELMNREDLDEDEMGYLGITGKNIDKSYASGFNKPMGVYVYSIDAGSPAETAGIVFGDIITSINNRPVSTMEEIQSILSYTKAGTTINVTLQRLNNGSYEEKNIAVVLANRP